MRLTGLKSLSGALVLLAAFAWSIATAAEDPRNRTVRGDQSLAKPSGTPIATCLNINNFLTWQRSNGQSNWTANDFDGGYYPRGTAWVIYQDGLVWRAKAYLDAGYTQEAPSQLIRVGGSSYNVSTTAGWVTGTGATAARTLPSDPRARMWRIRRDYKAMSDQEIRRDASEFNEILLTDVTDADVAAVKAQYNTDWTEWPTDIGAPYVERNGQPGYQAPPPLDDPQADGTFADGAFTVEDLISGNYDEPGVAGADPTSPADQVMWTAFNDLDETTSQGVWGADPLGLELQVTVWGYKRADALGQLYFKRYKFINKGGVFTDQAKTTKGFFYIDSMYVCQWSDPDLGSAGDDLAGCDTLLSLGFVYNGNASDNEFNKFQLKPPAVGYDFLAGPLVAAPGDSAVFDLKRRYGFANLPMTSFAYFSAGSPISDPGFNYNGALEWYRMLDGYVPESGPWRPYPSGPFPPSKFPLSGDPATQTGFVDGLGTDYSLALGDRRILLNSGPFALAPGDTQEVVIGTVAGLGSDRLSSVSVMKFNDRFVQNTFDALFAVPKPPPAPDVKIAQLDEKVILEWGSTPQRTRDIESRTIQPGGYTFEGYNVYQVPTAASAVADGKRIATYDLATDPTVILDEQFDIPSGQILFKPVQFGTNSGVRREFLFDRDYIKDVAKLYNGTEYYLAVTAYARTTTGYQPAALESTPNVYRVVPQSNAPGFRYPSAYGDTLAATHTNTAGGSLSDGNLIAQVVNPTALTGATYTVRFDTLAGNPIWHLLRTQGGRTDTVAKAQTDQTGSDLNSPVVDGIRFRVYGAALAFKRFQVVANGSGPLANPVMGAFAFNNNGFPTLDGLSADGVNDRPPSTQQVQGGRWGIHTGMTGANDGTYAYFVTRVTQGGARWSTIIPYDWEIRFTAAGGFGLEPDAFTGAGNVLIPVPFELWRTGIGTPNDPSDDSRLFPYLITDGDPAFGIAPFDHVVSGGDNDPETDWFYWAIPSGGYAPGQGGYDALLALIQSDVANYAYLAGTAGDAMRRMVLVNWNGGSVADASFPANLNAVMPEQGTVFRIISTKPNQLVDVFTVTAPAAAFNQEVAKQDVGKIGVWPNPYYAFNPQETSRTVKFVTFSKLPPRATLRIFNVAGQLVRTMEKDDASQFLRWDLNNQDNFPVASGMYIVHVDMPELGATKVLKVGVIQEQEVPTVF